jgi:hypothetical protein
MLRTSQFQKLAEFGSSRIRTVFRIAAFAAVVPHAAQLRADHHPVGERLPPARCDEGARRGRGSEDGSPSGAACDTDLPI